MVNAVLRMIRCDRQTLLPREATVHDGGQSVGRVLIDRSRVAIPGGVSSEPGEVWKAAGVEVPAGSHERSHRQLIEDHQHDGSARRTGFGLNLGGVPEDQVRHVREQQEQRHEYHRRRAEHAEERARRARPRIHQSGADAQGQGQDEARDRYI